MLFKCKNTHPSWKAYYLPGIVQLLSSLNLFSPQNKKKLNFFGKEQRNNLFEKKSGKTQVSLITPKLSRQNSGATFFNCTNRSERQFLVLSPIISGINEKKKKFVRNRINKSKSVSNMFENAFIKQQMQLNEKNK